MTIKNLLKISLLLNIIFVSLFVASSLWADTNGIWDFAKDVRAGTFGSDQGGENYTFPSNLFINNNLVIKNNENVSNLNIFSTGIVGNNLNVKIMTTTNELNTSKIVLNGKEMSSWPDSIETSDCYWSSDVKFGNFYYCNPTYAVTGFIIKSSSTFQVKCCKPGETVIG